MPYITTQKRKKNPPLIYWLRQWFPTSGTCTTSGTSTTSGTPHPSRRYVALSLKVQSISLGYIFKQDAHKALTTAAVTHTLLITPIVPHTLLITPAVPHKLLITHAVPT